MLSKLLFAALLLLLSQFGHAASALQFKSEGYDFISGGVSKTWTSSDGNFSASTNYHNGVSIYFDGGSTSWNLDFAAPQKVKLLVGSYESATRFPFQSPTAPGLSVSGSGRGCNTSTGRFVIREIVYSSDQQISSFAADFEQHCEGGVSALKGAIRINSDIPLEVTTPTAAPGISRTVTARDSVSLDASTSSAASGNQLTAYHWAQTSGSSVTINNADSKTASFVAPDVALAGEDLSFTLTVTDNLGQTASAPLTIHVQSFDAPKTYLTFVSDAGDYIGAGLHKTWSGNDGSFTASSNYDNGVSISFSGGDYWWSLDFAAPQNGKLAVGSYANATRFPFQSPTAAGLSVGGTGRGCNTSTGSFVVKDVSYATSGYQTTIKSFAADFEQHCGGGSAALRGTIYFNSTGQPSVTTPPVVIPVVSLSSLSVTCPATLKSGSSESCSASASYSDGSKKSVSPSWSSSDSSLLSIDTTGRINALSSVAASVSVSASLTDNGVTKSGSAPVSITVSPPSTTPTPKPTSPPSTSSAVGASAMECFFTWAETDFAALFPTNGKAIATVTFGPYSFRSYGNGKSFLAFLNTTGHVLYVGPLSGDQLLDLGDFVTQWRASSSCF